jgi:hypothetical protein
MIMMKQEQHQVIKANAGKSIKPQSKSCALVMVQYPQSMQRQLQQHLSHTRKSLRPKSVRFSTIEDVKEVVSVKNLPLDTKRSIWYDSDDCKRMVDDCLPTLSLMERMRMDESCQHCTQGLLVDESCQCTRGLEDKTNEGFERRRHRIQKTIEAVLEEQLNQWEALNYDPVRLAKVSSAASSLCQMDARLTARIDEVTLFQDQ